MRSSLLAFLIMLAMGAFARADQPAPSVIILDASGSMAAREPDGDTKLDAARRVVTETLAKWPAGGELALIAYGHRRKSDCADIETLVEMGPVSASEVQQKLKPLRARGKTPLSQSLSQAAKLLPANGGSIILVSDGIETCNADPCAVASELRKTNPSLIIHVVGFGLAKGEATQLSCIAENGGGKFFDVGSASQLTQSLDTIKEEIAAAPVVSEPAPQPAPPTEPAPVPEPPHIVRVGLAAVAQGLGPIVDAPVRWEVKDDKHETVFAGESRALSLDLAAGTYEVVASAANAQGKASVIVTGEEGKTYEVEVPAGRLDLALAANKSAAPFGDLEAAGVQWTLEPDEGQGKVEIPSLARPSLLLAPGRYKIGAKLKGLEATALATVVPGAPAAVTLDFRLGTVVLEAAFDGEAETLDDAAMLSWRIGEGDRAQTISGQARPRLVLPEGRYPVTLSIAGADVPASAEVSAAEERVARVVVGGGELALSARLGPQAPPIDDWRDAFWTLEPAQALSPAKTIEIQQAAPNAPLPPGRWHIGLKSGTVTVEKEVMVAPGSKTALDFDLGGSRLTASATPAAGERAANTVYSVFALDATDTPATDAIYEVGSSEDMSTILPAGKWRVVASDSDGRAGQADIELGIGEERSLDLKLE
ncbi:VWA domain-containing protein [Pseudaminobacter soli (ex Li et al. 2025)]|nr:VWA domain-containing protein [Mesorhizobium soli]